MAQNFDDWEPPEPVCEGDLQIIILEQDETAPFSGQFFTHDAAACIASRIQLCINAARAELWRQYQIYETNLETQQLIAGEEITARDDTIDILEDELAEALEDPWYESFGFQFTVGLVGGVGIGYLLNEVLND